MKQITSAKEEIKEATLQVFLGSRFYMLKGNWRCDLHTESLFLSDVIFPFTGTEEVPVTRCLIHPEDIHLVNELIEPCEPNRDKDLHFRIISTYGKIHSLYTSGTFECREEMEQVEHLIAKPFEEYQDIRQARQQADWEELQLQSYQHWERITMTGIWNFNTSNHHVFYSDGMFRLHGLPPQSLNAHLHTFHSFIHPEDRSVVINALDDAYRLQVPLDLEYRIVLNNEEVRHVSHTTRWTFNSKGEWILSGILRDISDASMAQLEYTSVKTELGVKEQMVHHAESMGRMVNWHLNLLTRKISYSDAVYRMFGLKPTGIPLNSNFLLKYVHPDDRERMSEINRQVLYEHVATDVEFRIIRPDGKVRYLRQKGKLIIDSQEEMIMIGTIVDISENEIAEKKIAKVKSQVEVQQFSLGLVEELTGTGNWIMDIATRESTWSKGIFELLGLKATTIQTLEKMLLNFIHPEDKKLFTDNVTIVQQGLPQVDFDFRINRSNEVRKIHAAFRLLKLEDKNYFIGSLHDVTNEILEKEKFIRQETLTEMMSDASMARVFVTDINNYIISWNYKCETDFGIRKEKVYGKNIFDVLPQLKTADIISRFQRGLRGESVEVKDERAWLTAGFQNMMMIPVKDAKSQVNSLMVVIHDVTHEYTLRHQLTERLQFIEKLLEASVDRIIVLDRNMNYAYWNKKAEHYYGIRSKDVVGRNILELFPAFVDDPSYEAFRNALKGETVHIPASKNLNAKKGYFETYLIPIKDEKKGEVTGILWIVHDLIGEYYLAQQQRKANHILESINEAYAEVDFTRRVRFVNPRAEKIWNRKKEDILGETIDEIFPDALTSDTLQAINQSLENRTNVRGEFFVPETNNWIYLSCTVTDEGVILLFYDITETRNAGEKLLVEHQRLKDAEAMGHIGNFQWQAGSDEYYWSDEMFRIYKMDTGNHMIPVNMADEHVHPEDRVKLLSVRKKSQEKPGIYKIIHRIVVGNGQVRWVSLQLESKVDEGGRVNLVTGIVQDITERKNAEDDLSSMLTSLEMQNSIYEHAEEIANMGTWTWNADTNEAVYSDKMYRLFGLEPNELKPGFDTIPQYIHPDDRHRLLKGADQLKAGEMTAGFEYRVIRKDGRERIFRNRVKRIGPDRDQNIFIGTTQDVTEETLLRQELEQRSIYTEGIMDASINRIMVFDSSFTIIAWNKESEQVMKIPRSEALGKKVYELFPLVWKDDVLREAHEKSIEGTFIHLKAKKSTYLDRFYERFFVPIKNEKGKTYAVLNIMHDVTEMVHAGSELASLNTVLARKNKELEQKNDEITNFTFVASHDLKEPLRKVHLFADWLLLKETETLSKRGKEVLEKINRSISRMEILIDDILVLTRVHSGLEEKETVDLNALLKTLIGEMHAGISASRAEINIGDLPVISGCHNHLLILFRNLIDNSLKFKNPDQFPHISISSKTVKGKALTNAKDVNAEYKVISVQDNGVGFDPVYQKKIFQVFQRLHRQDEFEGTGMGLAICKKIMEIHGGFITASGSLGKGATFSCYFPFQ